MRNFLITALVAGTVCSCSGPKNDHAFVRSVVLTSPRPQQASEVKSYSGIVREAHQISLGFKTAGQIARIHVKEGDRVRQGQLLAELDDADYRLAVEAARIQYDQLKGEADRARQLFDQNSMTANDYEKLSAGVQQLAVQLQAKSNQLEYTRLTAPADGYVQAVNFSPAELVDAGTPVFTLLDVSHLEVTADLPVREYRNRDRFTGFACRIAGSGGETFPMKLLSLAPKADGNQLYQLKLLFSGVPGRQLTAGMNVEVDITLDAQSSGAAFTLPLSAVFHNDGMPCVWIFNPADSTVTRREVTLGGADADGRALIRAGLAPDEAVVSAGVHALQQGERVRVLKPAAVTNVGGVL